MQSRLYPEAIPTELRELTQWVCWQLVMREGKPTKVPVQPDGSAAKSNDPTTWADFDTVWAAWQKRRCTGIGFVFSEHDPYVGIDLDHCRLFGCGEMEPWAWQLFNDLASYTELSPSETGLHIIVRGRLPKAVKNKQLEMYDRLRYFTMTGRHVMGSPHAILARQPVLDDILLHIEREKPPPPAPMPPPAQTRSDGDLLAAMLRAKNSPKFQELWHGGLAGNPSTSEADLALLDQLVFWTRDPAQLDRLFRQSGRARADWDDPHRADGATLGQMNVEKALGWRA